MLAPPASAEGMSRVLELRCTWETAMTSWRPVKFLNWEQRSRLDFYRKREGPISQWSGAGSWQVPLLDPGDFWPDTCCNSLNLQVATRHPTELTPCGRELWLVVEVVPSNLFRMCGDHTLPTACVVTCSSQRVSRDQRDSSQERRVLGSDIIWLWLVVEGNKHRAHPYPHISYVTVTDWTLPLRPIPYNFPLYSHNGLTR